MLLSWRNDDAPASPLWWAEVPLYAAMIAGLLIRGGRGFGLTLRPLPAALTFVALSWSCGMIYELGLTVDGTGIGGIHPDTRASFVLGQGDYILIALATLAMVRFWHLGFAGAFWVAAGKSLTEGLIFTGVLTQTLTGPNWAWSPLVLSYYTLAYASFVALPLLILAPQSLWRTRGPKRTVHPLGLIAAGFAVAFVIRVIWGLGWAPVATRAFDLPPNPVS